MKKVILLAVSVLFFLVSRKAESVGEEWIDINRDTGDISFGYTVPTEKEPAFISAEICIADGCLSLTELIPILSDSAAIKVSSVGGTGFSAFKPGIYKGRLLYYDNNFRVIYKEYGKNIRLYDQKEKAVQGLKPIMSDAQHSTGDQFKNPPVFYSLIIDLKRYEIDGAIYADNDSSRNVDILIFVWINSKMRQIAAMKDVSSNSVCMEFSANPETADMISNISGTKYKAQVEFLFSDTYETWKTVDAEIIVR